MQSITDITQILRIGGNLDLSRSGLNISISDIHQLARVANANGAHLTIHGKGISVSDLHQLARIGRANVTIVL